MSNISKINKDIHLAILNENYRSYAFKIYNFLIKNNFSVYWNYKYNLKKSLSIANEKKVNFIIIIGENELNQQEVTIKNMANGNQINININSVTDYIKEQINEPQ